MIKHTSSLTYKGFTLIELMIVMSIVALLMGMVGPLAINSLEKAEAKQELHSLKNWLGRISYQAYAGGQELRLIAKGKKVEIVDPFQDKLLYREEMKFIFFQPQVLIFNNKGFVSPTILKGTYRDKTLEIELRQLINNEMNIIENTNNDR